MGIRLLVVDVHPLCRQGLAWIAEHEQDIEIVGEAAVAEEARVRLAETHPTVVTIDVTPSDGGALSFVRELRQRHRALGIVVLAGSGRDDQLFRAMEDGASAYVANSDPVIEVVAAIRHAAVSPASFSACGLAAALARRSSAHYLLSPRERDVLTLLMDGLPIAQIARRLHLSHSTAKTYTSRLYEKLGAGNRTQAIMTALRLGLIPGVSARDDALGRPVPAPRRPVAGVKS